MKEMFFISVFFPLLSILGIGLPLFSKAFHNCKHDINNFRCVKYVKNYDGDTITVNIPKIHPLFGENAHIRVLGIDTPELRTKDLCEKKVGYKAKEFVEKAVSKANKIDLENVSRGKYFRIVADVKLDGKSLTQMLLKKGLGVEYYGGRKAKINWCFYDSKGDVK